MVKAKKKAATKKSAGKNARDQKVTTIALHIEVTNGREKVTRMEVLKVEKYRRRNQYFEIDTQRNDKKKKLVIDVCEIKEGARFFIHELRRELKIEKSDLKAEAYTGYAEVIAAVKESINMYCSASGPRNL